MPDVTEINDPTVVAPAPLLPCGDTRCGHGLLAHSTEGRCGWVACRCGGYQWTEAAR